MNEQDTQPSEGWQYIQIPLVKHSRSTLIKDIHINNTIDWKSKIVAQCSITKKNPYYPQVMDLLDEIFRFESEDIVTFIKSLLTGYAVSRNT